MEDWRVLNATRSLASTLHVDVLRSVDDAALVALSGGRFRTIAAMECSGLARLRRQDLQVAARMCAHAFEEEPHTVYFFADEERRSRDSVEFFRMRIRYGLRYGEVRVTSTDLEGIAVWLPAERAAMTMWGQIRSGGMGLYRAVGKDAVARMTHVAEHNERLRRQHLSGRHWFLSILAVDPEHRHRGHASKLLRAMLDRLDRDRISCYAETTQSDVLPFYERHGFEIGAESTVPGTDLTVWPLVRLPSEASGL